MDACEDMSAEQQELLQHIEAEVRVQLANKPKRLHHVEGVVSCAGRLAQAYGVDAFSARAAAWLHDWCKAVPDDSLVDVARDMGLDLGVDLALVAPVLHGFIAARILPERFPQLDQSIFRAIEVHTTAEVDMTPLDMVLFVADGMEPSRPAVENIVRIRQNAGKVPLEELFWDSFTSGIAYVIERGNYLWPGTLKTYNELALQRKKMQEDA